MPQNQNPTRQPQSEFARKLAADPELAAKCKAVVQELRRQIQPEIDAIRRSEQLTAEDFKIVINARAEDI